MNVSETKCLLELQRGRHYHLWKHPKEGLLLGLLGPEDWVEHHPNCFKPESEYMGCYRYDGGGKLVPEVG